MPVRTAPENEHDPCRYQSLGISSDIASRYLDKLPSELCPPDHQILPACTWLETPDGKSVPLHYDSYV